MYWIVWLLPTTVLQYSSNFVVGTHVRRIRTHNAWQTKTICGPKHKYRWKDAWKGFGKSTTDLNPFHLYISYPKKCQTNNRIEFNYIKIILRFFLLQPMSGPVRTVILLFSQLYMYIIIKSVTATSAIIYGKKWLVWWAEPKENEVNHWRIWNISERTQRKLK